MAGGLGELTCRRNSRDAGLTLAVSVRILLGHFGPRFGLWRRIERRARLCIVTPPMRLESSSRTLAFLLLGCLPACSGDDGPPGTANLRGGGGGGLPPAAGGLPPGPGGTLATGGVVGGGGVTAGSGGFTASGGVGTGGVASGGAPASGGVPATGGAGSGGAGGAGGAGETGGAGGASQGGKPPCLANANQIFLMGDSYVNWISHTFPSDINAASKLQIANYAVGGTSMGSGGIGLIPDQFDPAFAKHPNLTTVIMDGGGNDVLVPDTVQFPQGGQCKNMGAQSPTIPDCQKIVEKALSAGRTLFMKMAQKGVKDVIFFFYPIVPKNTLIGGTDPNGMNEYARPKIKVQCDTAYEQSIAIDPQKPIRCHFVDMVPVFQGHPEYFADADIHPNAAGSKAMAAAVWSKMQSACVGQPASSGCCQP